ncbi:hypothetical protein ACFYO1_25760 [Nocardia sp. NPDC006044]|uniref:hypothetical protein n=1 Tax=Nocardia sp. NPDC006044 TaxID=3364306 RepID=UPI00367DCCFB
MSGDRTGGFFRRGAGKRDVRESESGSWGADADRQGSDEPGTKEDGAGDRSAHDIRADEPGTHDRTGGSRWRAGRSSGDRTEHGFQHEQPAGGDRTDPADSGVADDEPTSARAKGAAGEGVPEHGLAEFAAELKLLAEAVLERVEPVLRQAADGQVEWSSCSWCPVCAAAALMRGQHHEVLQAVADHGTALVTVLREALAGVPVDPVMPEPGAHQHNHGVPQDHSASTSKGTESTAGQHTSRTGKRSRYVGIPVTIKA